jgi:hypothetical protein
VAQLGSALRSGRRGRRFKSCHPDTGQRPCPRQSDGAFAVDTAAKYSYCGPSRLSPSRLSASGLDLHDGVIALLHDAQLHEHQPRPLPHASRRGKQIRGRERHPSTEASVSPIKRSPTEGSSHVGEDFLYVFKPSPAGDGLTAPDGMRGLPSAWRLQAAARLWAAGHAPARRRAVRTSTSSPLAADRLRRHFRSSGPDPAAVGETDSIGPCPRLV